MTGPTSRERCPNVSSDGAATPTGGARREVPFCSGIVHRSPVILARRSVSRAVLDQLVWTTSADDGIDGRPDHPVRAYSQQAPSAPSRPNGCSGTAS